VATQLAWSFEIDTTVPALTLTSPAANAALRGTANLIVQGSDSLSGVSRVAFRDGGAVIDSVWFNRNTWKDSAGLTRPASTLVWNTLLAADGPRLLDAVATDQVGNQAQTAAVPVVVDNTLPQIGVTVLPAPLGGQVFQQVITFKGTITET